MAKITPEKIEEAVEKAIETVEEEVEEVAEKLVRKMKAKKSVKPEEVTKKIDDKLDKEVEEVEEAIKEKLSIKSNKSESDDKKSKIEALKEKAKKLAKEKVEELKEVKASDIKKAKPEIEEKKDALVPIEDYLKASIHLGTRVITPDMRQYVYRRRADGLAVFNTALLDDKIKEGAEFLAKFAPQDIILVCKRESGWKAAEMFSKLTGIRVFAKKYPAGILTNSVLDNFIETELVFIADPWLDKNALQDANRIKIPVLSICDTNNFTQGITKIIPGNNKSAKSLGIIFYLMAKVYVERRKLKVEIPPISEWIDGWDTLVPPK
jgi:small subunit ribosomal protein S2